MGSPYGVSGAAWLPAWATADIPALGEGSATVIRMEEFPSSVLYRLGRLAEDFGTSEMLDDAASRAVWTAIRNVTPIRVSPGEAVWLVSTRPSRGPHVLAAAAVAGARGFLDWSGGRVWLAGPGTELLHTEITTAVEVQGGTWTLMRAPDPLRAAVDVVPREPAALAAITRRVKGALDPRRHLQSWPPLRGTLAHANQLHGRAAPRPGDRILQSGAADLRALRLLHRDLPDLRIAGGRAG